MKQHQPPIVFKRSSSNFIIIVILIIIIIIARMQMDSCSTIFISTDLLQRRAYLHANIQAKE